MIMESNVFNIDKQAITHNDTQEFEAIDDREAEQITGCRGEKTIYEFVSVSKGT